jgi:8-oxo-dGTP diphosphatase
MSFTYEYPRPAVTADILLFTGKKGQYTVLLVKRKHPPFQNQWALPGGFINMDETLLQAAGRELEEETGIREIELKPFRIYDKPDRDPRGRTITQVFYAFLDNPPSDAFAGDDAAELGWFVVKDLPALGFDHKQIIEEAVAVLGKPL